MIVLFAFYSARLGVLSVVHGNLARELGRCAHLYTKVHGYSLILGLTRIADASNNVEKLNELRET